MSFHFNLLLLTMCPGGVPVRCREGKCFIMLWLNLNLLVGLFLKRDLHKGFFVSWPLLRLPQKTKVGWNPQRSALSSSWISLWKAFLFSWNVDICYGEHYRHSLQRFLSSHTDPTGGGSSLVPHREDPEQFLEIKPKKE